VIAPKNILITGATGGIGSALALAYATSGVKLFLQGRDANKMAAIAVRCEKLGASVETSIIDVKDIDALVVWVHIANATAPLDLVIPCAGININTGPDNAGEIWRDIDALIDINIKAVIAVADAVMPSMRERKRGQIALFSSLAGYFGLPVTPSYCASKAAIKAYGEALRGGVGADGVEVNVVMPGFVESQMCDEMPGNKPLLWTAEKAAQFIKRGLERNHARISFPFPLNLGCWYLAVAPAGVAQRLVKIFGFGG
jgi:short-subunit dehydrogenase